MPPSDVCQKLSLSLLYFNKTLLHKSSEQSSLVSGPGLNSSPPGAKNPGAVIQQPFTQYKLTGYLGFRDSCWKPQLNVSKAIAPFSSHI